MKSCKYVLFLKKNKMKKVYVILTAGGVGRRMGGPIAKQFIQLEGKPVLLHTIDFFRDLDCKPELLVVLPDEYKDYWKKYCTANALWFRHTLVTGGITRFHSVKNALAHISEGALVMVHDGVRPFVDKAMIDRLFSAMNEDIAGVIPVLPMVDSMRRIIGEEQTEIVDRSLFVTVQTPQLFSSAKLKHAYSQAYSPLFTDDASVVESAGYKIATVEGSRANIKITTPEDLVIGAAILNNSAKMK